jgi:two-component system, NtrC family, nitrogen regulation sensor histidine kinase NtrY
MKERRVVKRQHRGPWVMGLFALLSFTVLVILQTSNIWKNFAVETASDTLILYALSSLNFIALVVFGFIFLRSLVKLIRERRAFQLGSRLKTKLLVYFAAVSLLPILAMAGFSYLFMNRALERWFTSIPESIVRAPLDIEARANAERFRHLEETARVLAVAYEGRQPTEEELTKITAAGEIGYISVSNPSGVTLVEAGEVPEGPEAALVFTGRDADASLRDGLGVDAAVVILRDGRILHAVTKPRAAESVTQMVDSTLAEFDRMKGSNVYVRQVGLLTLGVLTFLLIFASTWTAFYIARGLTVPIRALAEGAEEIARGKLGHKVDAFAEDELALLVSAFNEMSTKLEENSAELVRRRRYIETVLLSLPTGVITVDEENRVDTVNPAARSILRLEQGHFSGISLGRLVGEPDCEIFERLVSRAARIGYAAEQTKLRVEDEKSVSGRDGMPVSITATALPEGRGAVIVLEDLSELIAAQRASAWQEVARRMAHEIKNPLTPIQLSAERIAKRFKSESSSLAGGGSPVASTIGIAPAGVAADDLNSKVVAEGTNTILREVQSLKSMVDEFSRFARLPEVKLKAGDVNEVIREAVSLYEDRSEAAAIDLKLAEHLPSVMLDEEQLKRVFVNLIDNAIEAPGNVGTARIITISSRLEPARDLVVAEVSDNGRGIDPADYQKLFQPYFSTKGRGTGLGLAIVSRIVIEHQGKIKAVPDNPRGAKFIIELPIVA